MYVITGATGNTGSVAAERLLERGEKVRVIGRDAGRLERFVQKGAEALVGNVEDAAFLASAFAGARAAYLVVPQAMVEDLRTYQERISDAYAAAVAKAGLPYAVALSSVGGQHVAGTGPIVGLHKMEEKLKAIANLNVLSLRAAYFMENFFPFIDTIRSMSFLPGPFDGDMAIPMIATKDIGAYAAEQLLRCAFSGAVTRDLLGPRDVKFKEAAKTIGAAIGKPGLNYLHVPAMMLEQGMKKMGLPKDMVAMMAELWEGIKNGLVAPTEQRSAANTTPTTFEEFATSEFAPRYLAKSASA